MAKQVVFVLGSDSDLPDLEGGFKILRELGVSFAVRVLSAHRTPHEVAALAESAAKDGVRVLIGVAGLSAALPGVLAAHSLLPVIGVPMGSSTLGGVDALYSVAQMPPGVPVAATGIGASGARNAALIAARILALQDAELGKRLQAWVAAQAEQVRQKDARVRAQYE